MPYVKTTWANGVAPALNETNLNKIEDGIFNATTAAESTAGLVPVGGIIMWSGTIAGIPVNWFLCNGANGTPDLRDKFIVGATSDDAGVAKSNIEGVLKSTGGATGHSHSGHAALSHSGASVADHSGLTHGVSVANHPDLTHVALASHPALTLEGLVHDSISLPGYTHPVMTIEGAAHANISLPGLTHPVLTIEGQTHANITLAGATHADVSLPGLTHPILTIEGQTHAELTVQGQTHGGVRYDRMAAIRRDDDEVLLIIAHIARIL